MPELNNPRLILTPTDKNFLLSEPDALIQSLKNTNFIDEETGIADQHRCFSIGDDFLHQVTFLGCSPTLFSDDDSQDVFISIACYPEIQFFNSSAIPPPRCPHCQKTDKNWQQYRQHWDENKYSKDTCPNCGKEFSFREMKWKKNGGYARFVIQIHGIQEQLAIPNPQFIETLQQLTQTDWEYFFAAP